MADFAILTCISRYASPGFATLNGPLNDLKIVKEWLKDHGRLADGDIEMVVTPHPFPMDVNQDFDADRAPPVPDDFDLVFKKLLRRRMKLGAGRAADRLYLYFSGHGFCNRSQERAPEAALYSANATPETYDHIFGTFYARVAVGWALFKEVVLIMDCCRDSEVSRRPLTRPYRDTPDDGLAADVKFLAIYAVPKGGKAQELQIVERDGEVHGLLTHALIKLLKELPPTDGDKLSSYELQKNLLQSWASIFGEDAPPRPEIYLPGSGDILFPAVNRGSPFEFRLNGQGQENSWLQLTDAAFKSVAMFALDDPTNALIADGSPVISHDFANGVIKLRMKQGLYQYRVTGAAPRTEAFKVDGSDGYVTIL
jgi:hypothetical protein